jgi:hypothetical protein
MEQKAGDRYITKRANEKLIRSRFTYFGNEIRTVTEICRNTNIKPVQTANATLRNHLSMNPDEDKEYTQNGIRKLKRDKYSKVYTGLCQTGRDLKPCYVDHIGDVGHNKDNSKYAKYSLEMREQVRAGDTVDILKITTRGWNTHIRE